MPHNSPSHLFKPHHPHTHLLLPAPAPHRRPRRRHPHKRGGGRRRLLQHLHRHLLLHHLLLLLLLLLPWHHQRRLLCPLRLLHGRQGGRGGGSGARERVGGTDVEKPARHAPARPPPLLCRGGGGHGGDGRHREWLRLRFLGWGLLVVLLEGRGRGGEGEVVVEGEADVAAYVWFGCGWKGVCVGFMCPCLRFNESDTQT